MKKLKVQLHIHTRQDPEDNIKYSEKDLINKASKLRYEVLAISCHDKLVYSKELVNFAEKKGVLLIPAIEKTIEDNHVLMVNVDKEAEKIDYFIDLEKYKKDHPECLIIAPHPYHAFTKGLRNNLIKYSYLFDAVEWSAFYTKSLNPNKKAAQKAKELNKPLVGNGDVHFLRYLDFTYSLVDAEKKDTQHIINAIKKGNIEIKTKPINFFQLAIASFILLATEKYKRWFFRK